MNVQDIMTNNPACCIKDTSLRDVARMMDDNDCGAIPVIQGNNDGRLIGIVTDRDIVCRTLADGKDPFQMAAGDCMSVDLVCVHPSDSLEDCAALMKQHKVRRLPVVDDRGQLCGMVAQADIALQGSKEDTAEVVHEVSEPAGVA